MGRKKARSQPSRRSPSAQSSLAAQKRRILRSTDWITKGLAFCTFHGPWSAWEQRLLKELSLAPSNDFTSAVRYSRDVLKRSWPDLEPLLVRLMPAPDLIQLQSCLFFEFIKYARYHDGSPTLELEILAQGSPAAAFAYAAYGTRRRWQDAEALILSGDTAATPALSTGIGDILNISQWASSWESQAVTYARLFLPSGWPELEDKMSQGGCHPQVAYEYAVNVLQGPLPEAVETALTLQSFGNVGKDYISKYLAYAAAKRSQPSQGYVASSPTP
jgi:hypothetical protein